MTEKKAKQETKLANSETSQNGFWKRALLSQLKKIDRGSLTVETNNGTQHWALLPG